MVNDKVKFIKDYQKKMRAYYHVMALLSYDESVTMPKGGGDTSSDTQEMMAGEIYALTVDPEYVEALTELYGKRDELDAQTRREVEVMYEDYDKTHRVPKEVIMRMQKVTGDSIHHWEIAKKNNDFEEFRPYLAELIELKKQYAHYIAPDKDPYDVLLDDYEKGMTQEMMDEFFANIKKELVPLIHQVAESEKQPDASLLEGKFDIAKQKELSLYLMDIMKIDPNHCILAETEHPFTTDFSKNDVRITTKYLENDLLSNMFSVVHESGHAMYELNTGDNLIHSCLGHGATTAMHESQSRLWENMIARSYSFCKLIFPKVQELFPEKYAKVSVDDFYRAVNIAKPSLIRTDADELTYAMHIMVRYEMEKKIIHDEITVEQIPAEWNRLYKEYLGIDVPDDTRGVLQDIHWACGDFGYFPSYALGSACSAQFMNAMRKEVNVDGCAESGDYTPVCNWLIDKIYRHGMMLTADELLKGATGESFDSKYFVDYIKTKYTALYL